MTSDFFGTASDFLQHYQYDACHRWSHADLQAQQSFVRPHLAGKNWLDFSNDSLSLRLLQAFVFSTSTGIVSDFESILIAGPVTELVPLESLLDIASRNLKTYGHIIGIIPCLKDNSPQNKLFAEISRAQLWPYLTVDELKYIIQDRGLKLQPAYTEFVPIPSFNKAVQEDRLRFKQYRKLLEQIEKQGYSFDSLGWGELRWVAQEKTH